MSQRPSDSFDDPGLKAALRRQFDPTATATPMTRARVRSLFSPSPSSQARPASGRFTPWRIAAAALLSAGVLGMIGYFAYHAYEQWEYVEANRGRFAEMAAAHAAADHTQSFGSPADAARAIGQPVGVLSGQAGLTPEQTAATTIGGRTALRVTYLTQAGRVSVLSLPAEALIDAHDGFAYTVEADGHTLVGAVRGGNVYCVIADPTVDRADVRRWATGLQVVTP